MKFALIITAVLISTMLFAAPAMAGEQNTGLGVMVGYSIVAGNDAVEDFALGVKYRLDRYECAIDFFRSEFPNGGYDKVGVFSIDYTWDFARIPEEDYGIYVGSGFSYLGATDYWGNDGFCWNLLVGYDYTSSWSIAGRFFYAFDGGDAFAAGGLCFLF